jgi:hypothetical protein
VLLLAATIVKAGEMTFVWRANPQEDHIVGYRLYYGTASRLAGGHYQYYIDFTSRERCVLENDEPECIPLTEAMVTCRGLFLDVPECTINGLQGGLYFAMTAYNSVAESNFTQEIFAVVGSLSSSVEDAILQQVYLLLL